MARDRKAYFRRHHDKAHRKAFVKKQQARQQQRIENLRKLVEVAERCRKQDVPVQMVKDILSTTTQDVAEEIISQIPSSE